MPHPSFDLRHWRKLLLTNPNGEIDESDARFFYGLFTDSPNALVVIEPYRYLAYTKGLDLGLSVPVERFTFGSWDDSIRKSADTNRRHAGRTSKALPFDLFLRCIHKVARRTTLFC